MHVGVPFKEPQQLIRDGLKVDLLCREQWKTFGEIEAHLPAECRLGTDSSSIGFFVPVVQHVAHQIKVELHLQIQSLCSWEERVRGGTACQTQTTARVKAP